jgi:thiamine-phosphate pyrophosphorylase
MRMRQARPLPSVFLMTDERVGEGLWQAIDRLPRGAAIIFRHYSLAPPERRLLFERVRIRARRRGLMLIVAGSPRLAIAWKADGAHGRSPRHRAARRLMLTAPAHDRRELNAARRGGAALIFVSPVHATRSHPASKGLGLVRLGLLIGRKRDDVVALGGMTSKRARNLRLMAVRRWGAIDAWTS